mmetsp:Transcript_15466/g.29839  ORF Transcript_15466/g.29839 Transcript_15466/m.29839 type:complete len:484 (+) Transcript_15466:100-1551(+)
MEGNHSIDKQFWSSFEEACAFLKTADGQEQHAISTEQIIKSRRKALDAESPTMTMKEMVLSLQRYDHHAYAELCEFALQAQKLLAEQQVRTESELELCLQKSSSGAANAARISRGQCLDMSEFHKVQVETLSVSQNKMHAASASLRRDIDSLLDALAQRRRALLHSTLLFVPSDTSEGMAASAQKSREWRAVVEGSSVAGSVHAVDSAVGETESRPQWSDFMVGTLKLAALAALLLTMNWAVQARFGKYVYAQARLAVSRSAKRRFLLARKGIMCPVHHLKINQRTARIRSWSCKRICKLRAGVIGAKGSTEGGVRTAYKLVKRTALSLGRPCFNLALHTGKVFVGGSRAACSRALGFSRKLNALQVGPEQHVRHTNSDFATDSKLFSSMLSPEDDLVASSLTPASDRSVDINMKHWLAYAVENMIIPNVTVSEGPCEDFPTNTRLQRSNLYGSKLVTLSTHSEEDGRDSLKPRIVPRAVVSG